MKKLLSLLLSAVMVISLTVPAFAAGPDGPRPEKEAFLPEAYNSSSLGIIGGADGPTSIFTTIDLEDWDLSTLEELFRQAADDLKEAYGGVAGQVGIMVNGRYVKFPDAAPEITNGRTMVPVRALVETLGGEADYQNGTVQFVINGREYEFAVGSDTVTVSADGTAVDTIKMDCAPYIKGGRTYVPIRFISEALGYEVGWDDAYQTAVLLDREAMAADIDKNFSILNRVQAAANPAPEEGKSQSLDMKGSLSVTAFDTINGDQTYKANLNGNMLLNSEALNGTCSVTFSDSTIDALMDLMELMIGAHFGDETDENVGLLPAYLTDLKDMEVIINREGMAWFHAPLVDELSGEENLWAAADIGAELGALMFAETNTATVGSALVSMLSGNSVAEMAGLDWMSWFMDWLYSDDKFTTSEDGTSTRTIGVDELMGLYKEMGIDPGEIEDEIKDVWKEYNITMKVDSEGGVTVTEVMETAAQMGVPAVRMTVDSKSDGRKTTMTMNIHVANLGEMKLTLTVSQKTTDEVPSTEPPKDATIVKEASPVPEDHR